MKIQEILFKFEGEKNYCEGHQTLEEAARRGCGVSILSNIPELSVRGTRHCPLAASAPSRGVAGLGDVRGSLQCPLFCDCEIRVAESAAE